ncbi:MAG TPA: hypothetical protein VGZ52_05515 [Acidimicrobiales bacterium]|nr:hypothetical protein [Acidimicrobiales bacterium]
MADEKVVAAQPPKRTVSIVPHTHWDREWYSPFQTFRLRLVDLLDDLLPRLDADPSYAHFMLDGQMAVVDDYLEVRPGAEATLRRLAASGRLSAGPWYILMDEFLVSGETTVRNLQRGLDRAAAFGGAMNVGYLPDMFGHVAQMPQLLRQFGFEHAVVWRGVPSAVDRSAFWWSAPDGSTVRAEYLVQGYGNGARLPDDAKALVQMVADFESDWSSFIVGPLLWMNGTDHLVPQPWLGRVVAEANDIQDEYELVVTSLAEHLSRATTDGLPSWTGELRSGSRSNLLMGVTSNRVDVRAAAARAERSLEQLAEPLTALYQPPDKWPDALLDAAWLDLIRNSAHDSICACSVDEVCDAVLHRYADATQIGEGLAARALDALARSLAGDAPVIVNPSARARAGLVEVVIPGNDPVDGVQVLNVRPAERVMGELDLAEMAALVVRELKHNDRILGLSLESVTTGAELWTAQRDADGELIPAGARAELDAIAAAAPPGDRVRIKMRGLPTQKVIARVADVPGFGWKAWAPSLLGLAPVTAEGHTLDNGLVRVEIAGDGTWAVNGNAGFGRLVHGGDVGDTYNWCPPDDDVEIDAPIRSVTELAETGPLRARARITSMFQWPERHEGPLLDTDVVTTLELRAGERLVRVETSWTNRTRDQRVRVTFPLPRPAAGSTAECVFGVVERGLEAEGGPTEMALATYPSKRFVRAGGLTVIHDGVREYELIDVRGGRAHTLALTLARCTGLLSQMPMATRPLPAGPITPMEGSQLQRPIVATYAVHPGDDDPFALADDVLVPLQVTKPRGRGVRTGTSGQALSIDGAPVSSLRRVAGRLEVRVFNPSADTTTVTVDGRRGWLVDLRGRPVEQFEERFTLAPWRIATAVLDG